MAKPLPKYLTDVPSDEIERQQKEFKKAVNIPARQDNDEARVTFAISREQALRATLEVMYRDNIGGEERQEIKEMLAGALMDQGRFHDALKVTEDADRREEIHRLIDAIERDDKEECDCPKEGQSYIEPESKTKYTPAVVTTVKMVPSFKDGFKMKPVRVCSICGDTNIGEKPTLDENKKLQVKGRG